MNASGMTIAVDRSATQTLLKIERNSVGVEKYLT